MIGYLSAYVIDMLTQNNRYMQALYVRVRLLKNSPMNPRSKIKNHQLLAISLQSTLLVYKDQKKKGLNKCFRLPLGEFGVMPPQRESNS